MKPSRFSTSSTLPRSFDAGLCTLDNFALCALRMRVSKSPKGSENVIFLRPPLPARLDHAGNLAGGGQFPQGNTRDLEFSVIAARAPRKLAPVVLTHRRGIARDLRQLQARRKTLLHGQRLVIGNRLQPRPAPGILLRQADALLVTLDHTGLRHKFLRPLNS